MSQAPSDLEDRPQLSMSNCLPRVLALETACSTQLGDPVEKWLYDIIGLDKLLKVEVELIGRWYSD